MCASVPWSVTLPGVCEYDKVALTTEFRTPGSRKEAGREVGRNLGDMKSSLLFSNDTKLLPQFILSDQGLKNKQDGGAALRGSLLVAHVQPSAQVINRPLPLPGWALPAPHRTMPFVDWGRLVDITFSSFQMDRVGTDRGRKERERKGDSRSVDLRGESERFPKTHHLSPGELSLPKLNFQPQPIRF